MLYTRNAKYGMHLVTENNILKLYMDHTLWYHNKRGKLISEQEGKVDIITRGKVDITTRGESWYHNKRGKLISQQEGKVNITTRGES